MFDFMPESMTMMPNGKPLFVPLLVREYDYFWYVEYQLGFVAGFDLSEHVRDRLFRIPVDPFDILATSNGLLVISSGSGQWTIAISCDATSGKVISNQGLFERTKLALHPSESIVYGADTCFLPSDIYRADLESDGSLGYFWDSRYHGEHRMDGNVWCSPTGDFLVTRGGDVFTAGNPRDSDMLFVKSMADGPIEALMFDEIDGMIVTVEGQYVRWYDLAVQSLLAELDVGIAPEFVGSVGSDILVLDVDGGYTRVFSVAFPES